MTINREHLATQKILDLILDECRYWQGRDEARRGGFAILYSAAKEIADQAQAATAAFTLEIGADGGYCVIERDVKWLRAMRNKRTHQIHDLYTAPQHDAERDALRAQVEAMRADSDLYRQWFNAVQDSNSCYLERKDYQAAIRLLERLGMRVPLSVVAGAALQVDKP